MNIDNLMDQLIAGGVDFKTLSKAYDDAADRKEKRDTAKIAEAHANIMQAVRKYTLALYGEVDEDVVKEFETTLNGLEKLTRKPTSFSVKMQDSNQLDEEKLRKFLKSFSF